MSSTAPKCSNLIVFKGSSMLLKKTRLITRYDKKVGGRWYKLSWIGFEFECVTILSNFKLFSWRLSAINQGIRRGLWIEISGDEKFHVSVPLVLYLIVAGGGSATGVRWQNSYLCRTMRSQLYGSYLVLPPHTPSPLQGQFRGQITMEM